MNQGEKSHADWTKRLYSRKINREEKKDKTVSFQSTNKEPLIRRYKSTCAERSEYGRSNLECEHYQCLKFFENAKKTLKLAIKLFLQDVEKWISSTVTQALFSGDVVKTAGLNLIFKVSYYEKISRTR